MKSRSQEVKEKKVTSRNHRLKSVISRLWRGGWTGVEELEAKKTGLMLFSGIGWGALGRKTESSRSDKLRLRGFGLIWVCMG